jgi:hypothetical protein
MRRLRHVELVNDLDRNLSHGPSFCIHQHIGLPIKILAG